MRLLTAEVDRYGPLYDCRPPCRDGITVVSGPNEAGKTLYLEALLQLLEPAVADVMDPGPRVETPPAGRVVVEHRGEHFECDGSTTLCSVTPIEPAHLPSVFVVRDGDLRLPGERAYYASLVETLGDVHTTEIERISSALKDRGRLTDARLQVSSDRSHDSAGEVLTDAADLASDVREYVERITEEGTDELSVRRLETKRRLREVDRRLDDLAEAKVAAEYERLSSHLETYRSTSRRLDGLEAFDRETLEGLRDLRRDIERDREDLDRLDEEIRDGEAAVEEASTALEALTDRRDEYQRREPAVEDARAALEAFRARGEAAVGAERHLAVSRPATVAALLAAGVSGAAGASAGSLAAVGVGAALLVAAVVAGVVHRRADSRLTAVERAREAAVRAARDAGFDVETVSEVAVAIERFDRERGTVRQRVAEREQRLQAARATLRDRRAERADVAERRRDREEELRRRLEAAGVDGIEDYRATVEDREALEPDRRAARQSLVDRLGEPDADDPAAAAWSRALEDLVGDVDLDAVDPDSYDSRARERLETERERLESDLDALGERLDDHDARLDEFDRRARGLATEPFVGRRVELEARSRAGLERLADALDEVVERIERDAELSRKALELFDRIAAREEQKLAELFQPDGPASRTLELVTQGRYTQVAYDPDAHELGVERRDGRSLGPAALSQATRDQLYFASRVSLAQQLLGATPGFLLLDDPFLAADPVRLTRGFEALRALADDGWQIVYLTAKREVREGMVEAFDLDRVDLEPASLGG